MLLRFVLQNDGICGFCGMAETSDHLFFSCSFPKDIWTGALLWLQVPHQPMGWSQELPYIVQHTKGKGSAAKVLKMAVTLAVYYVWHVQNQVTAKSFY